MELNKTNTKSSKVRGLRLTVDEEELVDQFLAVNPIFDFTTLTRAALRAFITNPQLSINPISNRVLNLPNKNLESERSKNAK